MEELLKYRQIKVTEISVQMKEPLEISGVGWTKEKFAQVIREALMLALDEWRRVKLITAKRIYVIDPEGLVEGIYLNGVDRKLESKPGVAKVTKEGKR